MVDQKYELSARARIQALSWRKCSLSYDVWTFSNCVYKHSKKIIELCSRYVAFIKLIPLNDLLDNV